MNMFKSVNTKKDKELLTMMEQCARMSVVKMDQKKSMYIFCK